MTTDRVRDVFNGLAGELTVLGELAQMDYESASESIKMLNPTGVESVDVLIEAAKAKLAEIAAEAASVKYATAEVLTILVEPNESSVPSPVGTVPE